MAKSTPKTNRLTFFEHTLGKNEKLKTTFNKLYTENGGDWNSIHKNLTPENGFTDPKLVQDIQFTQELASWSKDSPQLVALFQKDNKTSSMRDIALKYDVSSIKNLLDKEKISLPKGTDTNTYATGLNTALFKVAPSAVLQRMMATEKESPIADPVSRGNVATFLNNLPDFNIRNTSIYEAIKHPDAFKGIETQQDAVIGNLKTLQRISAISPVAEAVPVLMKANIHTAFRISEMPEAQFVKAFSTQLGENGETIALQIHHNAVNSRIQNEQALIAIRETGKGTGIDFIDKSLKVQKQEMKNTFFTDKQSLSSDTDTFEATAAPKNVDVIVTAKLKKNNLSWDLLFADADFCECEECTSVYSAAAYYVDLLQYLRNNNLDADTEGPVAIKSDPKDISKTVLERLFKRRPDLACLELTCKNTNVILPYVDLVNEILENFIVFQETRPAFNVADETSSELLAQPQHINYDAYCILHKTVYPFNLPYHQPIDAIRIFLKHLETSRHELIDVFRSPRKKPAEAEDAADALILDNMHTAYLDRAYGAEFLGLTQEEYVILTKQGFVTKAYWDKRCKKDHTQEEYNAEIGLKPIYEYYGYQDNDSMINDDESLQEGLSFVKKQFLPRTGVAYADLVNMLKTQYLNPMMPKGRAMGIMESLHFSYRYLQGLVDNSASNPKEKFKKLINFLTASETLIADALMLFSKVDPCKAEVSGCADVREIEQWVYCYFEQVGQMIVLEDGCHCVNGTFQNEKGESWSMGVSTDHKIGIYVKDCIIYLSVDKEGVPPQRMGEIDCKTGLITIDEGQEETIKAESFDNLYLYYSNKMIGYVKNKHVIRVDFTETCDITKTRLIHLDGSPLTAEEYDRFQRFIRLWHKLGWTIAETDSAIIGLSTADGDCNCDEGMPDTGEDCADCGDLIDDCDCNTGDPDSGGCEDPGILKKVLKADINPELLTQLVAVKKLLDKTGLELIKLLSFWADISTFGDKSLYQRLFLTHNLVAADKVFQADKNGNYLTLTEKISAHIPVLMAALNLNAEDINTVITYESIPDQLSPENVSMLYRYRLLSKTLSLRMTNFVSILPVFEDVFESAAATLSFFEKWEAIEDAGFDYKQLNYIIKNADDPLKPLAPNQLSVLKLAKNLYDGINAINDAHKDLQAAPQITDPAEQLINIKAQASSELVKAKAALIYTQPLVDGITGILEGSTIYTTNAPKTLTITLAEEKTLSKKLKYNAQNGAIQITGILTAAETADYLTLSSDPLWAAALTRIEKQQKKLFKELLSGVFASAEAALMAGDVVIKLEPLEDGTFPEDTNTAPQKRLKFLELFLPYLRKELIRRFIIETLSGLTGMDNNVTEVLITQVLSTGTPAETLYSVFESVQSASVPASTSWNGFLIPSADNMYTFIAKNSDLMPVITINGKTLSLLQQEDPTNEWWASAAAPLQAGKLYELSVTGLTSDLKDLFWKTPTTIPASIPSAMLLPDFAQSKTMDAFTKLKKTAIWVNGFNLSADEITWLFTHPADFDNIDFNAIGLAQFLRLAALCKLRNTLPDAKINILDFFKWTTQPDDVSLLSEKIAALSNWKKEKIQELILAAHFNLDTPEHFRNEINLLKLQKAMEIVDKIGMSIDLVFDWAKPSSHFNKCRTIAESIRKAIRAQYLQDDWEQVVKPLNDQLRENQKNALIAYLLVQPQLIKWGVTDADGLFECFLIDVQMCTCMETSRIKQAISSVQLFVQRCLLGLEQKYGVKPDVLDRDRWEWMQRYRVWEANRKVFLYPENWIESNLRDDKSSFFKELEGELLQKDINPENVKDALKSYLFKVDEVSNMEVAGLYIDGERDTDKWTEGSKLHVFSRTRNAPYFFYYRYFALDEGNWYPWEKMQLDIPGYDVEDPVTHIVTDNGCFLCPVVWNNRMLIFFPQIQKKTKASATNSSDTIQGQANKTADAIKPTEYYEVKMAWSEYRNGKWTQKQLSKEGVATSTIDTNHSLPNFKFVPFISEEEVLISIDDNKDSDGGFLSTFKFTGSTIFKDSTVKNAGEGVAIAYFNKTSSKAIKSWQFNDDVRTNDNLSFQDQSDKTVVNSFNNFSGFYAYNFNLPYTHQFLGLINSSKLEDFFAYNLSDDIDLDKDDVFGEFDPDGSASSEIYHELKRPYSIYNWELFFHTPLMLADSLSKAQQFEEAMKWYHFVFNPMAQGNDDKRFWQFKPFKEIDSEHILDKIFNQLKPNTPNAEISEWRNHPFMPHMVARGRPVAYMKWVVMKYIDNLLAWGDYLFRQDTIESINEATQLYILASHILGKRPEFIPKRGKIKPQTYLSMLDKWDAFSNAVTELEIAAPFSSQIDQPFAINGAKTGLAFANIFGFSSSLYFCIPNNPKLLGYWDTIADRLYKIRHCENFDGVFRKLPLFEPPIDPALLVKAAAQGLSIASVLNDLNTPMPNYRFYYLLQKALELCGELKSLGNAMLAAIEKKDNETIGQIRARHEGVIQNLVMEVKKQQLEEAQKTLDSLIENRKAPELRMKYYLQLVGEDINKVPGADGDFTEIANAIEVPVEDSGLKLITYEKQDMDEAAKAQNLQDTIGKIESLASALHAIPTFGVAATPLGVGGTVSFGGSNLGSLTQGIARWMQTDAAEHTFASSSAGKKGGFTRAMQERILQANTAGREIKQIDKQITTQEIRIQIANIDINNQQQQIDNALEIEDFLKNKYTNEELYIWMKGSLRTLYHQVYSLTYELAKKAEKVFRFERGLTDSNFIQAGYWDEGRSGLLAGEQLYANIKQLEAAYQDKRGYDYEVTKHISLRQINPLAVLQLKETGKCEFELPEVLFDMDYPGHYNRRIKSVALSIPCIAGPYTGLNATLRLLSNKFRNTAIAKDANDYLEKTEETDTRFNSFVIPISSIAASSSQSDNGLFELNFKDERYLPFEGAGAISQWRLELPSFRQFDYDTISDMVLHLRYVSSEGGERLQKAASGTISTLLKSIEGLGKSEGFFAVIDLKHDLPMEWHKAVQLKSADNVITMPLDKVLDFLPYYTKIKADGSVRDMKKINAGDVTVVMESLSNPELSIEQNESSFAFTSGNKIGDNKVFVCQTDEAKFDNWSLKLSNADKEIEKIYMVIRFVLKD